MSIEVAVRGGTVGRCDGASVTNGTGLAASIALALLVLACSHWSRDEVARATSPTGQTDAVLIETNGGATTSFGYDVYVVPRGGGTDSAPRVASFYGATRGEQAYGVNLRWRSSERLELEYYSAKSARLDLPSLKVSEQLVHVVLQNGIKDPTAPRGGMLYNLQGRPYDREPAQ